MSQILFLKLQVESQLDHLDVQRFAGNAAEVKGRYGITGAIADEVASRTLADSILVPHAAAKDCLGENCNNCRAAIEFMDWIEGMPFINPSWFMRSRRKEIEKLLVRWVDLKRYVPPPGAIIPGCDEEDEEDAANPGPSASAPRSEDPAANEPETTRVRVTAAEMVRMQMESEAAVTAQRRMQLDQRRQERSREQPSIQNPVNAAALLPDMVDVENHGNGVDARVVNVEVPRDVAPSGDQRKNVKRTGRSNGDASKRVRIQEPPAVPAAPVVSRVSGRTVQLTEKAAESQVIRNISRGASHVPEPTEHRNEPRTAGGSDLLE